jgi:hypothetical protein
LLSAVLLAGCASTLVTPPNPSATASAQAARTDQVGNVLGPVTDAATWTQLEARPLRMPSLAPGTPCPVSSSATYPGSATAAAFGDGPVFAVTGGSAIGLGPAGADGLRGGKVLWSARPEYSGPALIRGARLDGPGEVRFSGGSSTSLRFDLDTHTRAGDGTTGSMLGWRYLPSLVYLAGAGCYGFQVNLPDGTVTIITLAATIQVP